MGQLPKALRDKIAKAKASGGGTPIRHGKYHLMFVSTQFEQMYSGACLITEFIPVKAEKISVMEGEKVVDVIPNEVGSTCSYVINFDGKGKLSAEGNAKAVVLALWGYKEDEVSDEQVSETLGEMTDAKQPAKGMIIACETFAKGVRSTPGKFITGLKWSCVDPPGTGENTFEKAKARYAEFVTNKKGKSEAKQSENTASA